MSKDGILSFSLYGQKEMYLAGAVRNAEQAPQFYPGWTPRFYIGASVPREVVSKLSQLGCEIVEVAGREDATAMFWRFRALADVNVGTVLVRDADSRLSHRELKAVQLWLESRATFHIMRDHPEHNVPILGGMWGAQTAAMRQFLPALASATPVNVHGADQAFLERHVYPVVRNNAVIHDSFFWRELSRRPFPMKRDGLAFVGEAFDENEVPRQADRDRLQAVQRDLPLRASILVKSFLRGRGFGRKLPASI